MTELDFDLGLTPPPTPTPPTSFSVTTPDLRTRMCASVCATTCMCRENCGKKKKGRGGFRT